MAAGQSTRCIAIGGGRVYELKYDGSILQHDDDATATVLVDHGGAVMIVYVNFILSVNAMIPKVFGIFS